MNLCLPYYRKLNLVCRKLKKDGSGGLHIWHFGSAISGGCHVVLLLYLNLQLSKNILSYCFMPFSLL